MNDAFLHLTDDEGDPVYVRASQVSVIAADPDDPDRTIVQVDGKSRQCRESVADILDSIASLVLEVA
ncbi:hypothetical protein [Nocardia thailandica]|uniref:hypothetical protein n=1 Tax=Nocardia thailandica TaxID=257275 RepID=UPI00031E8F32|nr:hypothetical protein [Nocardia thailandica]